MLDLRNVLFSDGDESRGILEAFSIIGILALLSSERFVMSTHVSMG